VGLGYGNSMQPSVAILADCRYFGVSIGIQIKKISHELFTYIIARLRSGMENAGEICGIYDGLTGNS